MIQNKLEGCQDVRVYRGTSTMPFLYKAPYTIEGPLPLALTEVDIRHKVLYTQ